METVMAVPPCEYYALVGLLLCGVVQLAFTATSPGDLDTIDIRLVEGDDDNEGRVLVRWSPDSPWTAVCHDPTFSPAVAYQMCRRLGHPFACGQDLAGPGRTDEASLRNVSSQAFLARCSADQYDPAVGGCTLLLVRGLESSCTHDQDMWLSCGNAGMADFELRLVGGSYSDPAGLLQGRCGPEFEWSAICANGFYGLKQGRVACRELGISDYATSVEYLAPGDLDAAHRPNYTLFVDIGCVGNETSLTECQHYSLRECLHYVTMECFTEVTEYDTSAYLCGSKQLCSEQCEQLHPTDSDDSFHYCQCDDACQLFDDCCYDYADTCGPGLPRLQRGEFRTDQFGCLWLTGSEITHIGYLAVDRCPVGWTDDGTRELCEGPVDVRDVLRSLPVYDDQDVDFKNVYCAICNGRSFERLNRWNVSAPREGTGRRYPGLNVTLPATGWLITPPHGHKALRECPAHLVATCLEEYRGSRLEEACGAYYAPIKFQDSNDRYRNPHCAMCNGRRVTPPNSCRDQICLMECVPHPWGPCRVICSPVGGFLTIEVLFDFTSTNSVTGESCQEGEIFDPFLDRCRVLTCASGYQIDGDRCVVAPSMPPLPTGSSSPALVECLSKILGSSDRGEPRTVSITSMIDPAANTTMSAFVLVRSTLQASYAETAFDDAIQKLTGNSPQNASLPCNVSKLAILLPFSFNGSRTCNDFKVDAGDVFPGNSEPLLTVVVFQGSAGKQLYRKEKVPPLCLKIDTLNCSSLLTLEESEYSVSPEDGIQVKVTGARLSPAEHVLFSDGKAVVCSFIPPASEDLELLIRRVISFIGSLISLVALAATFVTYSVFRELWNIAGISTMNLVFALFTAILMFLLSGWFGQSRGSCEFGAVVAHLTWLAGFFWMTVLSFNVAQTVASMVPRRGRSPGLSHTLIAFICIAWGIPLAIVSVCLILHHCNCIESAAIYAENGVCWITDVTARVVAFVVPMAISLVLSVGFFVFAIVSLRRTRRNTRAARNLGKAEAAKQELVVYAKLSSVVGVTWLFGFISQSVTGVVVFSYFYILLNYLQGVFIFVAFCLNKRVRGMWRDKMRERESKAKTKTTSAMKHESTALAGRVNESTKDSKM